MLPRHRKTLFASSLLLASLGLASAAQTPQPASQPAPQPSPQTTPHLQQRTEPPAGATILHQKSQLVVLDVVVQDRDGHPVRGLKREDFIVSENKAPQTVRNFDAFSPAQQPALPFKMSPLPPGTFTDISPFATGGPLNILLLDALNTPMADQAYVRYQLEQYVKHVQPGTRIAIFGLTTHLILLQGFTADPEVLRNAVEHKLIPRASVLLDDPVSGAPSTDSLTDTLADLGPSMAQTAANVAQFEAQAQSFKLDLRVRYTLDAFHNLGVYLNSFPGRKNVMWFSGSFPLDVMPDETLTDPFATEAEYSEELRDTSNLLTQSQVAVYPIDARGLMTNPAFSASQSGAGFVRNPSAAGAAVMRFNEAQAAEHMTMEQMADDTGGHAWYNTNGLWQAVQKSIEAGSTYYTLTYSPTNGKADGGYRNIRVEFTGAIAAQGYKLAYRRGYYAPDSSHPAPEIDTSATHAAQVYAASAMDRGAPQPADILFKVRVLPDSAATEPKLAPGNQPTPIGGLTGPFRRYDVDMITLGNSFHTEYKQSTDRWTGRFEYTVLVYDAGGKLLNAAGNSVALNLNPATHATFDRQPIRMHVEISVPVKSEAYLRIGLHDFPTNHFGVVEIPVAGLAHLAPPDYATAPPQPASGVKPAAPSPTPTPATSPATTPR
jgi:VWFA-related protein